MSGPRKRDNGKIHPADQPTPARSIPARRNPAVKHRAHWTRLGFCLARALQNDRWRASSEFHQLTRRALLRRLLAHRVPARSQSSV